MMAVAEANGRWGRAREVAAPPHSGPDPEAYFDGIACWRAGYCWAIGGANFSLALALPVLDGSWGPPVEIGLPSKAAADAPAELSSVACNGDGSCEAVGSYTDTTGRVHAMAVAESDGRWGRAAGIQPPPAAVTSLAIAEASHVDEQRPAGNGAGLTDGQPIRPQRGAALNGVSCPRAGFCEAVGVVYGPNFASRAMAVAESDGTWQRATAVTAPANAMVARLGQAVLYSVACSTGGVCQAVGSYLDKANRQQATAAAGTGTAAMASNQLLMDIKRLAPNSGL
jgi:hypothetical protein